MARSALFALAAALCLSGCTFYSYTNRPHQGPRDTPLRATFDLHEPRGREEVLVVLAISGGGSRAAYFGASVMLRLQSVFEDLDVLKEVDAISAVSGGCLPAAYYCVSQDPRGIPSVPVHGGLDTSRLAPELLEKLEWNETNGLLGCRKPLAPAEETQVLLALRDARQDSRRLKHLFPLARRKIRRPTWNPETVRELMSRDYIARWIGNGFWPHKWFLYWFTAYDRSDIMAGTLADNLFDRPWTGFNFSMEELNPERPYLIVNSTVATENVGPDRRFGQIFTFTDDDFRQYIASDVRSYSVGRAVMASAAFPAVFNYMTLRDFRPGGSEKPRYLHVFDGGNSDNLGLTSAKRLILEENRRRPYSHFVVILVDARTEPQGVDQNDPDPRSFMSYFLDFNLMDTFDSLLEANRRSLLHEFQEERLADGAEGSQPLENLTFWHIEFADVPEGARDPFVADHSLRTMLNRIPTDFSISREDCERLDTAARRIVHPLHPCLQRIRKVLKGLPVSPSDAQCKKMAVPY